MTTAVAPPAWRWALASTIGTAHLRDATPCQDAAACALVATAHGEVLVAVAADGAGSAARGGEGARLACELTSLMVSAWVEGHPVGALDAAVARGVLDALRGELAARAEAEGAARRDYASTLLCAVVGPDAAAFFQVGDGAMVVTREGDVGFTWVFWPQQGEYANVTHFVTDDDAPARLQVDVLADRVAELSLFTDGLQALVLRYPAGGGEEGRGVHDPFFERMLSPLRGRPEPGEWAWLSAELARYLAAPVVTARTDDDKTLVLATRRPG